MPRRFALHGVPITVDATTPHLERVVRALLRAIAVESPPAAGAPGGITLRLLPATSESEVPQAPPGARCWMAVDALRLLTDEQDSYVLLDDRLVGMYSPSARHITAWIPPALADYPDVIEQMVVLPLLLEALRAHGFVSLHAAALAHRGRVALFPAESGAGKTTLTLALLRAGFQLLSDDCPLLRRADTGSRQNGSQVATERRHRSQPVPSGHSAQPTDEERTSERAGGITGILVHAFTEPLHVSAAASAFFPEVRRHLHARHAVPAPGAPRPKVALDPIQVYGNCAIQRGAPGAIIFPSISDHDETRLEPLDRSSALLCLFSLAMPSASRGLLREQFELFGDLVSTVPCYTMRTGRDFERLPDHIRAVLDTLDDQEAGGT